MKNTIVSTLSAAALLCVGCGRAAETPKAPSPASSAPAAAAALSKSVPAGWGEDFEAAKKRAAAAKKKILLAFSGSDWCPWCVKMERDVYSKPEFVKAASSRFELVMVDVPRDQSLLSELAKKQNRALAEKFAVEGFPCTVVVDAQGRELKRVGGYQRDPAAFLARLEEGK